MFEMKPVYWVLNPLNMEVIMNLPSPEKTQKNDKHLSDAKLCTN